MFTRDSQLWLWTIAVAVLAGVTANLELVREAFPGISPAVEARIQLASLLVGIGAGVARMSPLPISHAGRVVALHKQAARADEASVKTATAARATEQAAIVTQIAAEATQSASEAADRSDRT